MNIFVWTLDDVVGLVILGLILIAFGVAWIGGKIKTWRKK